ncbi:hypothetical protein N9T61_00945 [Flavobacteriaceae bacterium]|nr:hypothetical protein [Flavobacteriaceae bacterium]
MNKKLTFRYVFEVIVIVFSVTLSFYIQELLSDREKNLLKNDGLNGVIKDLVVDKSQFKNASDVIYYRIGLIEDVLDGRITNKNISSLMTYRGFLGQDSNYKSLISTGAIEYIKSDSLALRLSNYYEIEYAALLGESKSYNKLYLDLMSFMKENYRVSSMEKVERGMKSNGFLSFEYSNSELEKTKRDGELRNYFFELKRIIYLYARMFEGAMSTTDRL